MVQLTRIYTKGGDKGSTSLGSGKRVVKHDQRVIAYGTVDEANATVGSAASRMIFSISVPISARPRIRPTIRRCASSRLRSRAWKGKSMR